MKGRTVFPHGPLIDPCSYAWGLMYLRCLPWYWHPLMLVLFAGIPASLAYYLTHDYAIPFVLGLISLFIARTFGFAYVPEALTLWWFGGMGILGWMWLTPPQRAKRGNPHG